MVHYHHWSVAPLLYHFNSYYPQPRSISPALKGSYFNMFVMYLGEIKCYFLCVYVLICVNVVVLQILLCFNLFHSTLYV